MTFKQIEDECNADARRIVRGLPESDIENLNAPVQPEISGIEPRGEYDAFTVGVRHRG